MRRHVALVLLVLTMSVPSMLMAQRTLTTLPDVFGADSARVNVIARSQQQPLVVIRFLGAMCSHCVQQLVAINEQREAFKSTGARIVAFSDDSPSECIEAIRRYGLDTSVISLCSDPDGQCSRALGATIHESDGSETDLHALLVMYRGQILSEHFSVTPLMNFRGVLHTLHSIPSSITPPSKN